MVSKILKFGKQKGSSLMLRANRQGGSSATVLAAHFAKRNTKFGGGGTPVVERFAFTTGQEARASKNFYPVGSRSDSFGAFPQTPFLFARPSGKILIKIQNLDFRQKRFGLCRIIAQKKKALKPSF